MHTSLPFVPPNADSKKSASAILIPVTLEVFSGEKTYLLELKDVFAATNFLSNFDRKFINNFNDFLVDLVEFSKKYLSDKKHVLQKEMLTAYMKATLESRLKEKIEKYMGSLLESAKPESLNGTYVNFSQIFASATAATLSDDFYAMLVEMSHCYQCALEKKPCGIKNSLKKLNKNNIQKSVLK
jgi:hypothetical protein